MNGELEYIYNGMGLEVCLGEDGEIGFYASINDGGFGICGKEEAIAAARAILKHFDADEDDMVDRYRAPTEEELAKFLAENPKYKPIPKEAYDPDAPLTSELKWGAA